MESDVVTLTIASPLAITTEPEDQVGWVGKTVTFSVTAENAVGYQWMVSSDEGVTYQNATVANSDTASIDVVLDAENIHFSWKCVVTGAGSTTKDTVAVTVITTFTLNDVIYEALSEEACRLVSYVGDAASLVIPESFKDTAEWFQNMVVTEIGVEAFMDNTTLVSIDLPDTVEVIGARAFKGCTNLSQMS